MSVTKWFGVSALIFSNSVMAQSTLGELIDTGGKQIPQKELISLLAGLTMTGPSFTSPGDSIRFDYAADGTVSGGLHRANGTVSLSKGTWKVDESGKFCRDMIRSNGAKWGDCRYFYRLGDNYFAAETDDRGTKVEPRVFEKK